ncbi:E3 ubiquitin-protein ligase RNF180-like isoform X2 [Uranotaenia lowii]|uniref:E3 ubiquitin-protein ligase RNF180-like isoform X2 n=1 Tax=Uranotaenia lowii TaxID=190385 RepID=UPI002479D83D|nr:E3 ubiquitin-protein ligase RNF180-like isoform X2 [Uranotaenia lowii]XP_055611315.1 E3 ubiquitin-protein ligase RNF180-like isoform X2 [Uranotaenia lowii]
MELVKLENRPKIVTMMAVAKCKKCGNQLIEIEQQFILPTHANPSSEVSSQPEDESSESASYCPTEAEGCEIFLHEDHLPEWITAEIEQSQWTKGKLKCGKCGLKVGSFDFVSGTRCKCELNSVLPSVHLIKSKVDLRK